MELVPGNTLITSTQEDGRALALMLARHSIHAMQPDEEVLKLGGRSTAPIRTR
jgi:Hexameric tyrosine-coordinated heme protein (HTHP)